MILIALFFIGMFFVSERNKYQAKTVAVEYSNNQYIKRINQNELNLDGYKLSKWSED